MLTFYLILIFFVFIGLAFATGNIIELEHYSQLREKESMFVDFSVSTSKDINNPQDVESAELVCASVVISMDYFKRFLASLRNIIGGRVISYEYLFDRARREAVLRMIEKARSNGYDLIVNMRFEKNEIDGNFSKNCAGAFELTAYGTAIKFR